MIEILPSFQAEADALARIIALAYDPHHKLFSDPPPPHEDVVRLLGEALQCAYEAGAADAQRGLAL